MVVFVGGSRVFSRLNDLIRERLNLLLVSEAHVLVGDANGADKALQQFLAAQSYASVTVFAAGSRPRNNIGGWDVERVHPPRGAKGFEYYSVKDRVMASRATYGFMLWDGESRGTLHNLADLAAQKKSVLVYFRPAKRFYKVFGLSSLIELVSYSSPSTQALFGRELLPALPAQVPQVELTFE